MGEAVRADVGVIGAGVIGCAIAWNLARQGRSVLLLDREGPAAGASFGNAGHIATEQVEPLPSAKLLLGFWRELSGFDGPLHIPARRLLSMLPWMARFVVAAFRQRSHAVHFEPLIRVAADVLEQQLTQMGRRDLLRRNGHYALWLGESAVARAAAMASAAAQLRVSTQNAPADLLQRVAVSAKVARVEGLWFPDSANVVDPAGVVNAFAKAAVESGAHLQRALVRAIQPHDARMDLLTDEGVVAVRAAVVCAGAWSAALLRQCGVHAPLEAERGYHVELPGHPALADGPVVYSDQSVIVTPMTGRLRASSYLEFAGLAAPPDPRKPARLRAKLRTLGYECPSEGPSWMGPRPTLPDYLPGLGRARDLPHLYYAVGHQHLGLTLAAITGELMGALLCEREPRFELQAFDLQRFGNARSR